MYSGSRSRLEVRAQLRRGGRRCPPPRRRTPPAAGRPARPRARWPRLRARRGARASTASTSPGSMRKPRTFTWKSIRPRYSSSPSARQRTRSPVRYIRAPAGAERVGDEALRREGRAAQRSRAPARRRPGTARPRTPTGTGCSRPSSTYARVFATGRPTSTRSAPRGTTRVGGVGGVLRGPVEVAHLATCSSRVQGLAPGRPAAPRRPGSACGGWRGCGRRAAAPPRRVGTMLA